MKLWERSMSNIEKNYGKELFYEFSAQWNRMLIIKTGCHYTNELHVLYHRIFNCSVLFNYISLVRQFFQLSEWISSNDGIGKLLFEIKLSSVLQLLDAKCIFEIFHNLFSILSCEIKIMKIKFVELFVVKLF